MQKRKMILKISGPDRPAQIWKMYFLADTVSTTSASGVSTAIVSISATAKKKKDDPKAAVVIVTTSVSIK